MKSTALKIDSTTGNESLSSLMLSLNKNNPLLAQEKDSLLFIPDISGFTHFVKETEINHSRHIISELLELIIDSDELGLTVAEIEGDAILFYKYKHLPDLDSIIQQVEKMFIKFHSHLKQYEKNRICPCGACRSAHKLTIKFIAHAAKFDFIQVKDFKKPYGDDVILAHRLLKNNVTNNEYLLYTDSFLNKDKPGKISTPHLPLETGSLAYKELGEIQYRLMPLTPLHKKVPAPKEVAFFDKVAHPLTASIELNCSLPLAFEILTNFDHRLKWNVGLKKLKYQLNRVNRIGVEHTCIVNGQDVKFETIGGRFGENKLVYGELVRKFPFAKQSTIYHILEQKNNKVILTAEVHILPKKHPFGFLLTFLKKKLFKGLKQNLQAFKDVCEQS